MQYSLYVIGHSRPFHIRAFSTKLAKHTGAIAKVLPVDSIESSQQLQDALDNQDVIVTVPMERYNIGVVGLREKAGTPPLAAGITSLLNFRSVCVLVADPFSIDPVRYNVIRSKKRRANCGVVLDDIKTLI